MTEKVRKSEWSKVQPESLTGRAPEALMTGLISSVQTTRRSVGCFANLFPLRFVQYFEDVPASP